MRITSGMRQSTDTAWTKLARINKWGAGNTSGTAWPSTMSVTLRITVGGGGNNSGAISFTAVWKVWTDATPTPRSVFYADQAATRGIVIGVEDTGTYWQLVATGTPIGSVIEIETLPGTQPGFMIPLNNNPFTYTPVGVVGKPFGSRASITPSSGGTALQYIPVATIVCDTAYQRYAATFEVAELEGADNLVHRVSVLMNMGATAPATVKVMELTDYNRKTTLFYYTLSTTSGVSTLTLWAQSTLTYSTLGVEVSAEMVNASTLHPKVLIAPNLVWQTAAPSGVTRVDASHQSWLITASSSVDTNYYFANGWASSSGFATVAANGVLVVGRVVTLRLNATAGTLAAGTQICQISTEWKPTAAIQLAGVGSDASGNHYPIRIQVATSGSVTVVGTIPAGVTSIAVSGSWESSY